MSTINAAVAYLARVLPDQQGCCAGYVHMLARYGHAPHHSANNLRGNVPGANAGDPTSPGATVNAFGQHGRVFIPHCSTVTTLFQSAWADQLESDACAQFVAARIAEAGDGFTTLARAAYTICLPIQVSLAQSLRQLGLNLAALVSGTPWQLDVAQVEDPRDGYSSVWRGYELQITPL
eukprot:1712424-Amphidinium_carterae.1